MKTWDEIEEKVERCLRNNMKEPLGIGQHGIRVWPDGTASWHSTFSGDNSRILNDESIHLFGQNVRETGGYLLAPFDLRPSPDGTIRVGGDWPEELEGDDLEEARSLGKTLYSLDGLSSEWIAEAMEQCREEYESALEALEVS